MVKRKHLVVVALVLLIGPTVRAADDIVIASPGGNVQFKLLLNEPRPRFAVAMKDATVLEPSPMVMTVDEKDITDNVEVGKVERFTRDQTYPTRPVHATATDKCNGARVFFKHPATNTDLLLEIRAYDSGVAFRTVVEGEQSAKRVPDERTTFMVPEGSSIWHHNLRGHYEGTYSKDAVSDLSEGEWVAPPMTYKLPGGSGYASITEANLVNYSGMALECNGKRGFVAGLAHRQPVSYPYELRYSKQDIERLSHPAVITGTITTPWRVVLMGPDLNTLVNSDVISNCCPPPDPKLFPEGINTEWCKPGRAVWRYLDGGENSLQGIRDFNKLASQLGFEYQVVEGLWHGWSDDELRSLVDESKQEGVRLIVWEHSKNLHTPEARHTFFKRLHDFGLAGAKIDFFDHEHKETIDLYHDLLREAAENHLVLDFHGANKPTGESRTWPNELTREAIRGMESRITARAFHETTLPFTRFLAGHAEYTVVHFSPSDRPDRPPKRADTTAAHQIATAAVMSAELLTYSLNPQRALDSPACEMIKSIPSTWDETTVLPPSEIGELAIFARRSGETWFLACLNGPGQRSVDIPLSFLGDGEYRALMVKDGRDEPATQPTTQPIGTTQIVVEKSMMKRGDRIKMDLGHGGGFIARFSK